MAVTISGKINDVVYGKGDVCLKLNPFDNYRLFTLYDNWASEDKKPLDLSNSQKIYLVFKSKNKEIRIPEYETINSDYSVDKVNGQVLFKIDQKRAIDILAMSTKTFYITRVYETTDMTGEKVLSSDEEVLYTGQYKDETDNSVENYTTQIKKLLELLADRDNQIRELQESNVALINQNVQMSTLLEEYKNQTEELSSRISELETAVEQYESGTEYTGVVIGEGTHHTIISTKNYTEEQMVEALKGLETPIVD